VFGYCCEEIQDMSGSWMRPIVLLNIITAARGIDGSAILVQGSNESRC
jgi:hypothetical protein